MRGSLHVHSSYSRDGRDSLPDLRQFAVERGLRFLGLTDHAEDFDERKFAAFSAESAELSDGVVSLIPGLEFRFAGLKGMHLLAIGLTHWITPRTPEEYFAAVSGTGVFTIAAHPVYPRYAYPPIVLDRVDAIEVWNAAYNTRYLPDPRAIRLLHSIRSRRPEVVGVVGLDQHDARNDRETRIEVPDDREPLDSLREGCFTNIGRTMRFGATVDIGFAQRALLWAGRTALDSVERVQERSARWVRVQRQRRSRG
jgi:hypothetical protein